MIFDKLFAGPSITDESIWSSGYENVNKMTIAGVSVNEENALTYSAVFACVKVIAEGIQTLPWRAYKRSGKNRHLDTSSVADKILNRAPNPYLKPGDFKYMWVANCLLWGNFYAEIERNFAGAPVNLWPIEPRRVEIKLNNGGGVEYHVTNDGGKEVIIQRKDMFHIMGPSNDGIKGMSVIGLARETIALGMATQEFGSAFFGNGATLGGVITNEGGVKLNETGVKNLLSSFNRKHKGSKNAKKVEYLDGGMKFTSIGVPPDDAQFLETRKFQVTEIARFFNVPPHKLGDLSRSTHSNIESQNIEFVVDTLKPWTMRGEEEANKSLLNNTPNKYTKFNFNARLSADSKSRGEFYAKLNGMGVLSINEIREKEDMNPIEDGDLHMVPMNMMSVEDAANSDAQEAAQPVAPEEPEEEPEEEEATVDKKEARVLTDQELAAVDSICGVVTMIEINSIKSWYKKTRAVDSVGIFLEDKCKSFYESHAKNTADRFTLILSIIMQNHGGCDEQKVKEICKKHFEKTVDAVGVCKGEAGIERIIGAVNSINLSTDIEEYATEGSAQC